MVRGSHQVLLDWLGGQWVRFLVELLLKGIKTKRILGDGEHNLGPKAPTLCDGYLKGLGFGAP